MSSLFCVEQVSTEYCEIDPENNNAHFYRSRVVNRFDVYCFDFIFTLVAVLRAVCFFFFFLSGKGNKQ